MKDGKKDEDRWGDSDKGVLSFWLINSFVDEYGVGLSPGLRNSVKENEVVVASVLCFCF